MCPCQFLNILNWLLCCSYCYSNSDKKFSLIPLSPGMVLSEKTKLGLSWKRRFEKFSRNAYIMGTYLTLLSCLFLAGITLANIIYQEHWSTLKDLKENWFRPKSIYYLKPHLISGRRYRVLLSLQVTSLSVELSFLEGTVVHCSNF